MNKLIMLFALAGITFTGCSDGEETIDQLTHDCPEGDGSTVDSGPPVTERVDSGSSMCVTATDCSFPAGPCFTCGDGAANCPTAECVEGTCIITMPQTCSDDVDAGMDAAVE